MPPHRPIKKKTFFSTGPFGEQYYMCTFTSPNSVSHYLKVLLQQKYYLKAIIQLLAEALFILQLLS